LQSTEIKKLATSLGLAEKKVFLQFSQLLTNLYNLYLEKDCSIVEINPLVLTKEKTLIALDAKINFDDNGLFRHPEIMEMRDISEEDILEVEAKKHNLNYIKLDGNIGCMVNGAGLAMATMDLIKFCGGEPANFLDVGGGTNIERVANAFQILSSDKNIRSIFINIFGGIVRCDLVAQGIIEALKQVSLNIPVIIRLEGTNSTIALQMLNKAEKKFIVVDSFEKAARKSLQQK